MIYVDNRERKQKDINLSIPRILSQMKIQYEKRQLEIGDYIIVGNDMTVPIELKNADDYVNSYQNGRLNDQLLNLSANYDYPILLVYGSVTDALVNRQVKRSSWFHYLAGCVVDISPVGKSSRISVINVESDYDAANFISTIDRKISSGDIEREPSARKVKMPKNKERLYSLMWMFPSDCMIGKKRATALLEHFGSIQNVVNATPDELQSVDRIGKIIANKMIDHLSDSDSRSESCMGSLIPRV